MIEIGNTLVSFDLFDHMFCCDLKACRGCCCVEGDSGAPLEESEAGILDKIKEIVKPFLPTKSQEVLDTKGTHYIDSDGDKVTQLVENKECAFAYFDSEGTCLCGIEKAFREGLIGFKKPISCYLYPVRLQQYDKFLAVNIHRWECCRSAEENGKKLGLPAYKFLKEPLIERFGEEWYKELDQAAEAYYREFKVVRR